MTIIARVYSRKKKTVGHTHMYIQAKKKEESRDFRCHERKYTHLNKYICFWFNLMPYLINL